MKLLVTIPAYNEEENIIPVIKKIPSSLTGIEQIEILVINDGSTDNTVKKVKEETNAKIISHEKNRGVGAAFQSGINYALEGKFDIVINIDADGQFEPTDIPKLIAPILANEADLVTASRFIDKELIPQMSKIKLWGNQQVACLISRLTGNKFYDVSCGFRAYNREALLNLNLFGQFTYTQEVFLDLSFKNLRIKEVPIKVKYFVQRQSRVCRSILNYAFNILKIIFKTLRDYRPLKFFGWIGLIIFFIGAILTGFIIIFYFKTGGFTPYKAVGFAGIFLDVVGLGILFLALVIDMLYRIRMNQERLLYYEKRRRYYQ
ncbi:MAG: glycosyltransferase family 2 protein [bacterium]